LQSLQRKGFGILLHKLHTFPTVKLQHLQQVVQLLSQSQTRNLHNLQPESEKRVIRFRRFCRLSPQLSATIGEKWLMSLSPTTTQRSFSGIHTGLEESAHPVRLPAGYTGHFGLLRPSKDGCLRLMVTFRPDAPSENKKEALRPLWCV
jgi:hypothetical protein